MEEMIEFTFEDGFVKKDSRLSCNQLKTKQTSFQSFKNRWRNFKIKYFNDRLSAKKEEIVNDSFKYNSRGDLTHHSETKMNKKLAAIARLESKIMILSKENVPGNYVKSRAIKLKEKMMDNLWYNGRGAYSIGSDRIGDVFQEEKKEDSILQEPYFASATNSESLDKDSFREFINGFIDGKEEKTEVSGEDTIVESDSSLVSPEEVAETVSDVQVHDSNDVLVPSESIPVEMENPVGVSSPIDEEEKKPEEVAKNENTVILPFPIDDPVDGIGITDGSDDKNDTVILPFPIDDPVDGKGMTLLDDPDEKEDIIPKIVEDKNEESNVFDTIDEQSIREAVNHALMEEENKKYRSPSTKANIDVFDEYGRRKENYNYVPMTDEEIELARINIEKDLYDEKYREEYRNEPVKEEQKEEPVRDTSLVVPDNRDEEKLSFDFSQATEKDIINSIDHYSSSKYDLEELKKSIMELNDGIQTSKRNRDAAEEDAKIASERAKEAKKEYEASEREKAAKLEELYFYKLALEKQKSEIDKQSKLAREEAERNRNFIAVQQGRTQDNVTISQEVDALIPEDVRPKGR